MTEALSLHAHLFDVQLALTASLLMFFVWYYLGYARAMYRFAVYHFGLIILLIFIYSLIFSWVGRGLGIPGLFWHEDFQSRVSASAGATLLLGIVGVIAYFLDP